MKIMSVLLLALLTGCYQAPKSRSVSSINAMQPPVEQGEVWTHEEAGMMETVADIFRETLIESTGDSELMRRDAHPKHHGCVASELQIQNNGLPEDLRVGLFKENRKYQGIVRFSNGDPNHKKVDFEKDIRGMAVKLIGVPYESYLKEINIENKPDVHDLVFMNADAFFIPNPKAYEKFMQSTQGRFGVLSYLAFHWGTARAILGSLVRISNSLDIDYASATPYKLGKTSMKMKFKSCREVKDSMPENPTPNFLSERLEETLSKEEGCFDFYVQPNKDPKKNNIENAMVVWDEKVSPMIKVGRMTIKKQSGFTSASRMQACESMTFNPWRAPSENRPLGGVNRIRLEVYLNQSKLRHDHNGI